MIQSVSKNVAKARRIYPGHGARAAGEGRDVSVLVLLMVGVFGLTMLHDEIVAELVERGWLSGLRAETWEVLLCAVLFLIWSFLMLRLVACLNTARHGRTENISTGD
ncbi:hypothetical protein [uncultured Celeribacter sp.]|uniref:hypothetical protein n=1 Tax=uncultured Celeribacter sp. TaxID=1303376 RepID=UPI002AA8FC1E|nr:hypothetical protein [uncultured Celeribacter sp.]